MDEATRERDPHRGETPPGARKVRFRFRSGSLAKAQDDFEATAGPQAGLPSDELRVDLAPERHVSHALRAAQHLEESPVIDARKALIGALIAAEEEGSEAFRCLAELIPTRTPPDPALLGDPRGFYFFSEPLAESLVVAERRERDGSTYWGRDHVTTALLARDPSLLALAEEAGRSLSDLQDAWFAFVIGSDGRREPEGWWEAWWRDAGVPLPSQRRVDAGYLAESVHETDRLGIEADARAFALLIADANIEPPLSIGLLGDWGSGKSFFMRQIEDQVRTASGPGIARHIATVRFNAWHMSDANLWASLVGHIFEKLWEEVSPKKDPAKAREEVRKQIQAAQGAIYEAAAQVAGAREALKQAEAKRLSLLEMLSLKRLVGDDWLTRLHSTAKEIGWEKPLEAIVELDHAVEQLRDSAARTRRIFHAAMQGGLLRMGLPWVAASIAVGSCLVLISLKLPESERLLQQALQVLGSLGAIIGAVVSAAAAPISKAAKLVQRFTDEAQEAIEIYEEKAKKKKPEERAGLQNARREYAAAEAGVQRAQEHLAELEHRQASLDPVRQLTSFIEERARSSDYRDQQGIISLVHRDFETLARLMKDWSREGGPAPPEGLRPVDRIVLYVDDLDRCSPEQVVQALEAVHLLLALPLFVVVVAVDSRWLLRSLELRYSELLTDTLGDKRYRISTPQNYLEKIFQITYALPPMEKRGFETYAEHLTRSMDAGARQPREPETAAATSAATEAAGGDAGDVGGGASERRDALGAPSQAEAGPASPEDSPPATGASGETGPAIDFPNHGPLVIQEAEVGFFKRLHPLVTTPRLAKRIANVYRLIKARRTREERGEFEPAEGGRHRPILLLLAILYGRPQLCNELFRRLCEHDMPSREQGALHTGLRKLALIAGPASGGSPDVWIELAKTVEALAPDVTILEAEREAPELARYSIVTGQYCHTWRRREPLAGEPGDASPAENAPSEGDQG